MDLVLRRLHRLPGPYSSNDRYERLRKYAGQESSTEHFLLPTDTVAPVTTGVGVLDAKK